MSRFLLLNLEDIGLAHDITKAIQPFQPFCICCLDRDGPMIDLDKCSHGDYLDAFYQAELKPLNQLVCISCHIMLEKIKTFQEQVLESYQILLTGAFTDTITNNKKMNLFVVQKVVDLHLSETNSVTEEFEANSDFSNIVQEHNDPNMVHSFSEDIESDPNMDHTFSQDQSDPNVAHRFSQKTDSDSNMDHNFSHEIERGHHNTDNNFTHEISQEIRESNMEHDIAEEIRNNLNLEQTFSEDLQNNENLMIEQNFGELQNNSTIEQEFVNEYQTEINAEQNFSNSLRDSPNLEQNLSNILNVEQTNEQSRLNMNVKTALEILERNNQSFISLSSQLQFLNGEHLSFLETSLLSKEILTDIPLIPAKSPTTDLSNELLNNSKCLEIDGTAKIFYDSLDLCPELIDKGVDDIIPQFNAVYDRQDEVVPEVSSSLKAKKKKSKPTTTYVRRVHLTHEELDRERVLQAQSDDYVKRRFRCETCIIGFNFKENLEDHKRRKHGPLQGLQVLCEICCQTIPDAGHVTGHIYRHYTRYDCLRCNKRFHSHDEALDHCSRTQCGNAASMGRHSNKPKPRMRRKKLKMKPSVV